MECLKCMEVCFNTMNDLPFSGFQVNLVDGQRGSVLEHLKMEVTSNVHVIILQTLLSCLKSTIIRFESFTHFHIQNKRERGGTLISACFFLTHRFETGV